MSKEPKIINVTEEELARFERFKLLEERDRENEGKKEEKTVDKKEASQWTCTECGFSLGPADWTERQLGRAHPDGCPRCGNTTANIE